MEAGVWYNAFDDKPKEKLSYCDGYVRDIKLLEDVLTVAGKHNGRVFGGFVRDVIVPRLTNPECEVHFNDVDIWFTKQEEADAFIKDVNVFLESMENTKLYSSEHRVIKPGTLHYTFGRTQYHLYKGEKFVSFIDVVVSDVIPVDDFDVNCLTFHYTDGEKIPKSFSENSAIMLIFNINNKQVTMLPSYVKKLISGELSDMVFEKRVTNNFLKKGWKVYCFNQCVFPQTIGFMWINEVFKPTAKRYAEKQAKLTV
jgi:hypothetical protein